MHRFFGKLFTRVCQPFARRPANRAGRPRYRPQLEALENRDVPTIIFNPQFGAEAVTGSNDGMKNPNVYLVFSGGYWTTAPGQADEAALMASTWSILNGPYLSGLTQYGSDGRANYAGSWIDTRAVTSIPTHDDVQTFLEGSIQAHQALNLPGFNSLQTAPIYVVVSDPFASGGYNGGWNDPGTFFVYNPLAIPLPQNTHMIWIGTGTQGGVLEKDVFTNALSHELAETISDPDSSGIQVTPPSGLPSSLRGDNQIGDNEPAAANQYHYGYRLNGVWVQPYWSRQDNAFIVPDNNTEKFYLSPAWTGTLFSGTYNLSVAGDQLGPNDAITIGKDAGTGGVQVSLNGQTATFDGPSFAFPQGLINTINVDTGGGVNQVSVAAVPSGVALGVSSSAGGTDSVHVGSGGSLAAIQGTVNVSNSSGQTALSVDASADGGRTVVITDHSVWFSGLTTINYQGGSTAFGGLHGVTSLSLTDGNAMNFVDVESVPALTNVSLSADLLDIVYGPAAGSLNVHRRYGHVIYYG